MIILAFTVLNIFFYFSVICRILFQIVFILKSLVIKNYSNDSAYQSPTGETGGDLWFALRPSVSPSVTFLGTCDNFKTTVYFFMKLETWLDGNMEIMHIILFCSYDNNSGCYGNKQTRNNAKIVIHWDPAITLKLLNIFS